MRGVFVLATLAALGCAATDGGGGDPRPSDAALVDVTIDGRTFQLELAATVPKRARGLMYRDSIAADGGMLFVFPEASFQEFWMGWCRTPLDVIYLDPKARVTASYAMRVATPQAPGETEEEYRERLPRYPSLRPAQFVIELRGGTLDSLSVARGDSIAIDVTRLTELAR